MIGPVRSNTWVCKRPRGRRFDKVTQSVAALAVALAVGATPSFSEPGASSFRSAADAPAAWNSFAKTLRLQFEELFTSDNEVARRFIESLEMLRASEPGKVPPTVTVSLWVEPSGRIGRASFAPLPSPSANADFEVLLKQISADAPPPDMMQPVKLMLQLSDKH